MFPLVGYASSSVVDTIGTFSFRISSICGSTFGGHGHMAGQFYGAHVLAVNSKGDLFIGETYEGKRLQKFAYAGLGAPSVAP